MRRVEAPTTALTVVRGNNEKARFLFAGEQQAIPGRGELF